MGRRFDLVVGRNEIAAADKGTSMVALGLDGGVGVYIDNPDKNVIFSYDYGRGPEELDFVSTMYVTQNTRKVHLFVPDQIHAEAYVSEQLGPAIDRIRSKAKDVEVVFHDIHETPHIHDRLDIYSVTGKAWIDKEGNLYVEGRQVT
jgi:hypothetical protein